MSNELSLLFYLVIFSVSAYLLSFGVRRKSKLFTSLALLIPIVVGGFRFGVGTDYFNYVNIYNNNAKLSFEEFLGKDGLAEVMFFVLEKLSHVLFGDPRFMFISAAALTIVFFYLGLKRLNLKNPGLIFFLYLLILFPATFNAVRQGIAISIVFFAFTYILDRKPLRYLALTVLAGLFHISALFMLPVYFLGRYINTENIKVSLNKRLPSVGGYFIRASAMTLIVVLICSSVFSIVLSIPGFERYESYLIYNEESNNYIFFVKLFLIIVMIVLSKYTIFKDNTKQNKLFLTFAIIEVVLLTLGFVSPFIKRQALYFTPFLLILLPNLINVFNRRFIKRVLYVIIVSYGIAFFIVSFYVLGQAHIIPYEYSIRGGGAQ